MAIRCNTECSHYKPKRGKTNCPQFNEKLKNVNWVSLEEITHKDGINSCWAFAHTDPTRMTLDEVLGV